MAGISSLLNSKRVKPQAMILLFTSLSYMQSAGLTHRDGVDILMKSPDHKINQGALQLMKDGFEEGLVLSQILKENEHIYGAGFWRQVDAAERTGKVPECLLRIAQQLKNNAGIMNKIRGALAYPIFVMVVAFVAGYYLLTNTIPQMGEMMAEFGAELPALTLFLMDICDALIDYGWLVAIVLVAIVMLIVWALKNPFRVGWHKFITRFPLSGPISVNMNYSRVYLLINDMIENGSNIVDAVRIACSSADNVFIMKQLLSCAEAMEREGIGLAASLQKATSMPGDDRMMMDVGARTGREMELLKDLSVRRMAEANESVNRLLELMTPIIMLAVCAVVGVLVVSVYMPMLTMASSMG